jgi:hypothetical protein
MGVLGQQYIYIHHALCIHGMNQNSTLQTKSIKTLENNIRRLSYNLRVAQDSSIEIKESYDFYILSLKELYKSNEQDAFLYYDRANYELINAINKAKWAINGHKIHSFRTISFYLKICGLHSIIYSILYTTLFAYFIYSYGNIRIQNVPLWSAFYSGLGAYSFISGQAIKELYSEGIIATNRAGWFITIPILCMVSGYVAYLIFNNGLIVNGAESLDRASMTILICFLAGSISSWYLLKMR